MSKFKIGDKVRSMALREGSVFSVELVNDNKFDNVLNPSYYANRKIEVFDFISDTLRNNSSFTPEDGYQYGSITKYTARAGMKIIGNATLQEAKLQDLKKARRHLDEWIKSLELNTKEEA